MDQNLAIFSELFDIGGSHGHRNSRHVFYNNYQGLILVHDLTNRKSNSNLERWLREIVQYSNRCVVLCTTITFSCGILSKREKNIASQCGKMKNLLSPKKSFVKSTL